MIGAFKARFRTLIDQLRFGNRSMDQSMVLQGRAFFFCYEVNTDGVHAGRTDNYLLSLYQQLIV